MYKRYRIIIFWLLIFTAITGLTASDWETVKNQGGISVSIRPVSNSSIKEFMAVMELESSLSSLIALMDDTPAYTSWNYRCGEAKLLYKKDDYERITYMVTTSPWPVTDRDIAVRSVLSQDKKTGTIKITLTGMPAYIPARDGKVRMSSLNGYWQFDPLGNGKVRVTYRLHTEPGGSIPDSIVNSSLVDIPYNTLWNMRNMVKKENYKNAHYSNLKEM